MESMGLTGSLSYKKILSFGPLMARRNQTMRAFTVNSKSIQGASDSQEKSPIKKTTEAATNTEQVESTAKGAANQAIGKAQEIGAKAKQTVQKAKDAIVGKSEDTEDSIKEKADTVKRAMNTKNSY